ncbi:MAG: TlyA family RNA methyltransferase, partial [Nitrospinota bacterium]
MGHRKRLDRILIDHGLVLSRERARGLILSGKVVVDGRRIDKAGTLIHEDSAIEIIEKDIPYVSRGGLKLERGLEEFNIRLEGKIAIDVGASTGGFTDCLLKKGISKVYAVDVGYGQLAWELRNDPRVIVIERKNIRHITTSDIGERVDLAV